jgi:hypothetical protein
LWLPVAVSETPGGIVRLETVDPLHLASGWLQDGGI